VQQARTTHWTRRCGRRWHRRHAMPAGADADPWPVLPCAGHARAAGGAVRLWLRPPASGDLPRITAMRERCSLATRMARFHAPVRDIPARLAI
jgi:hypothetical protein